MMLDTTNTTSTDMVELTTSFGVGTQQTLIIFCALISILFGAYNVMKIMAIPVEKTSGPGYNDLEMDSL